MDFFALLATVRVAHLRSSWRSCFMRAALFIMRATSLPLVFTFSLKTSLFIHPHRQKSKGVRVNFKQLYLHTNWKLDTCLYKLIYSEWSIIPLPKIFTIPLETPYTCISISYFLSYKLFERFETLCTKPSNSAFCFSQSCLHLFCMTLLIQIGHNP
jgi:hypothetical protein